MMTLITYQQHKLLIHEMLHPDQAAYNMLQGVKIEGKLNKERLIDALMRLYEKERVLRIQYKKVGGSIYQTANHDIRVSVAFEKVSEERLKNRIDEEKKKPFHVFQDKLVRFFLYELGEDLYFLLIVFHHSICDGWSLKPLKDKIITLYLGEEYEISEDYLDYAEEQHAEKSRLQRNSEFWNSELANKNCKVDFTFDPPDIPEQRSGSNSELLRGPSMSQRIKDCCKKYRMTSFAFFYGCYSYLLHRYSDQEEITIAVPFANRMDRRWNDTIGCFVNPFPLSYDYREEQSVEEYFKELFKNTVKGISKAEAEIDMDCNTAFTFQNFVKVEATVADQISITPVKINGFQSKFDMELVVEEEAGSYRCHWYYDSKVFHSDTMKQLQQHYVTIIEGLLNADKGEKISRIEMLNEDEMEKQRRIWNQSGRTYQGCTNLRECIECAAEQYSGKPAVQFQDHILTYREFTQKTDALIEQLQKYRLHKGEIIAIQFERSLEMVIAIYAIIRTGCAYLPIAPATPAKRLEYIVKDSEAKLLVVHGETGNLEPGCPVVNVDFNRLSEKETRMKQESCTLEFQSERTDLEGSDPAYVIYTSGSTGEPKGVVNTHEGICNRLFWMQEQFQLKAGDAVLQKTPYTFDVSVWEFFWPLMYGGKLVVAEPEGHKNPDYLVQAIEENQISFIHFVPSMLNVFLKNAEVARCNRLKAVICSGEELKSETVQQFYQILQVPLANLYGPTEAAVDVSCYTMADVPEKKRIPIGKPIGNMKLYKLDKHRRLSPYKTPGELYISGIGLAQGYLNRPALTEERFLLNPWETEPYHRMYRTGDVVQYDEEGNLIYLYRIDNQVKLNGQRIELQEIEEKMRAYPGVEEAIVIVDSNELGEKYLIGFVLGKQPVCRERLLDFMRGHLMEYMIPHIICEINSVPLSANGKLDRRKLKEIYEREVSANFVPPRTPMERTVVAELERLLQRTEIGMNDDYFMLGGNSLHIVDFITTLNRELNMEIPFPLLIRYPQLKEFIRQLAMIKAATVIENECESVQLEKEAKVIIQRNHEESDSETGKRNILMTGGTGFLGSYLVSEIVQEENTRVYCLVRGLNEKAAKEKIVGNLKQIHRWKEVYSDRIHILTGNLENKRLGLGEEEIEFLKKHMNVIVHNGANVNFSIPYQEIKKANVESTKFLLDIMALGNVKQLVYISTLSVFSEESYEKGRVSEKEYPTDINHLTTGYAQSKLVSEHIIKQYADLGEDVTIVRLGRIIGEQFIGHKDLFQMLLELCLRMNCYPQVEESFDLFPVEQAGLLIGKLILSEKRPYPIYHLGNQRPMPMEEIGSILNEFSLGMTGISWEEWYGKCKENAEQGDKLAKSVIVLLGSDYKGSRYKQFIMDHGRALMKEYQIEVPSNEAILKKFLYHGGRSNGDE